MRDRRKRVRSAQAAAFMETHGFAPQSRGGSCDLTNPEGPQTGASLHVVNPLLEGASFVSRCSVRLIHEVVSKFDSGKKELVHSTGFGGILQFPPMKQINRKFSQWLMSGVDELLCTLHIGDHICLTFDKFDVGHIFGLPSSGKAVLDTFAASRDAKDRVIDSFLGNMFKEQRSIKLVQEIVEREYAIPITKEDGDRFRVAFVIFVVSHLLSPSAKWDYAAVDYWNAIQDPDEICGYDWCGFVITKLLEAVTKVKQDIANNMKFPNLTGCSLFLQVLYLDSLDLGELTLPHDTLPRISVFHFETIRSMMLADMNFNRHCKGDSSLPTGKLRDVSRCIYSWAVEGTPDFGDSRTGCLLAIWEAAVAFVKLLNIPLEAAGPLFVAVVDFQEEINSGVLVCGTQALKFLTLLASLITPFARGFRYQSSYESNAVDNGNDLVGAAVSNGMRLLSFPIRNRLKRSVMSTKQTRLTAMGADQCHGLLKFSDPVCATAPGFSLKLQPLGEDSVGKRFQCSLKRAFQTYDEMPPSKNTDFRVASTMARFYSAFRKLKPDHHFDLNNCGYGVIGENLIGESSCSSRDDVFGDVALPSPWELGYDWSLCGVNVELAFQKISWMKEDDRLAIVHHYPKYIQVKFCALCSQLSGKSEMELDLFDALVRIANQRDDLLFAGFKSQRWRYFFESDFMGVILDGTVDIADPKLRDHISLSAATFDLRKCNLVFFPALVQCQWACFVWQPMLNAIVVFEPSYEVIVPDGRLKVIERAASMLKLSLKTLTDSVFIAAPTDVAYADVHIMKLVDQGIARVNRSGLLCSLFYRCFDGREISTTIGKVDLDVVAAKLFDEVPNLARNVGSFGMANEENLVGVVGAVVGVD